MMEGKACAGDGDFCGASFSFTCYSFYRSMLLVFNKLLKMFKLIVSLFLHQDHQDRKKV